MNVAVKTAHIQRVCSLGSLTTTVGIIGRACRSLKLKKTRRLKAMIKAMILAKLIDFANKFHRVGECGEITY